MKNDYTLALIAALFGALLSSFGFLYRASRERKKLLNYTLYHLLEIWHAVRVSTTIDMAKMPQILFDAFERNFPGATVSGNDKIEIEKMIAPILRNLIRSFEINLNSSYQEAIKRLSVEEPLLSFELSGNHNLKNILILIDNFISDASKEGSDEETRIHVDRFRKWIAKHVYQEAMRDLRRHILRVARKVGLWCWLQVSLKLRRISRQAEIVLRKSVDEKLDELFKMMSRPPMNT